MSWWRRHRGMRCDDFVELITGYLDDAIDADERARIDRHLSQCAGCTRALAQWRLVISLTGHLTDEDVDQLDEPTRVQLTAAFREARAGGSP